MVWSINDIVLPIEPKTIKKKTIRSSKVLPILNDFPEPTTSIPTRHQLIIEGFIWPKSLARELDEATIDPDGEEIDILVTDGGIIDDWLSGFHSASNSSVNRDKPIFTKIGGVTQEVYTYKITFLKFAEADQTADEGGPGSDEDTGYLDTPETIGFDEDGGASASDIFNWLTNIITFGVIKT